MQKKDIIKKKKELKKLQDKYDYINKKKNIDLTEDEMKMKLSIFDKINETKKYIKNNENSKDIEYFLKQVTFFSNIMKINKMLQKVKILR